MSESTVEAPSVMTDTHSAGALLRFIVIALTAFLTVVDLFATQAILPSLARALRRDARRNGPCRQRQHHRHGGGRSCRWLFQPRDRPAQRRPHQSHPPRHPDGAARSCAGPHYLHRSCASRKGLCMAAAFTLTLAYLGEHCSAADSAGAFAAYITGNVASNLIGRLISAAVADHLGLASNFYFFAWLNLLGAVLVYFTVDRRRR